MLTCNIHDKINDLEVREEKKETRHLLDLERERVVLTKLSTAWKIPSKLLLSMRPRVSTKQEESGILLNPSKTALETPTIHLGKVTQILEEDGDMMFIEIVPKEDNSRKEEPKAGEQEVEYFDILPTRSELAYHKRKLDPRENANGGFSNFTGRIKGMYVFVGNFTYVVDFRIIEDIILGRPFVEISNMTHDPPKRVVRFTNKNNEVAYKTPHKIEQYNLLSNLEKEHTKSVYLRNEEDKRRGVEYVRNKILGFYKECLELGLEFATGMKDEGEVT
nr:retrotransposon Orf1 [Tanacetum cinerariifolium]